MQATSQRRCGRFHPMTARLRNWKPGSSSCRRCALAKSHFRSHESYNTLLGKGTSHCLQAIVTSPFTWPQTSQISPSRWRDTGAPSASAARRIPDDSGVGRAWISALATGPPGCRRSGRACVSDACLLEAWKSRTSRLGDASGCIGQTRPANFFTTAISFVVCAIRVSPAQEWVHASLSRGANGGNITKGIGSVYKGLASDAEANGRWTGEFSPGAPCRRHDAEVPIRPSPRVSTPKHPPTPFTCYREEGAHPLRRFFRVTLRLQPGCNACDNR